MSEDKDKKKEEAKEMLIAVVSELPKQEARMATTEDGKEVRLVTHDEALTELLRLCKEIHKAVA